MAQILVLVLWSLDWFDRGASDQPFGDSVLGELLVDSVLLGPAALIAGLVDGFAGRDREGLLRRTLLLVFVLVFAYYCAYMGVSLMVLEDLYGHTGQPPSVGNRLIALVGMEIALLSEWGVAAAIRRLRRGVGS